MRPPRSLAGRVVEAAVLVSLLAGCGSLTDTLPSAPPTQAGASPAATTEPAQVGAIAMCSLMPLADVQAKSPFQTPLSQSQPGTHPQMCQYRSADDAPDQVSILLEVTVLGSGSDAKTSLANARQAATDQGLPVSDVSGLGDAAFASGVDEVGVHVRVGTTIVDANLRGEWPDTTDDAKIAAGSELVRTIIARLP